MHKNKYRSVEQTHAPFAKEQRLNQGLLPLPVVAAVVKASKQFAKVRL